VSLSKSDLVHRSKFLSLVLRHRPDRIGITLDDQGWVDVDVLLAAAAAHGVTISRDELAEIVAGNDKQRFALSADGLRIRASQGHTVEVDLGYAPATPPEVLFHGTTAKVLAAIRADGLAKMDRHAVHLSADDATATRVGGRRGAAVVLRVRAGAMHRAGFAFQRSANGVWLTDHVPAEYVELPESPDVETPPPRLGAGGLDRSAKRKVALASLAACEVGHYTTAAGATVELRALIDAAVAGTRCHDPDSVAGVAIPSGAATTFEVTGESTIEALRRLADRPGLGCLNFASAKNPGGGFLNGAQAQEESLARASALYPCLLTQPDHYAQNRAHRSSLYLDLAIFSPDVPFFRDDDGGWLDAPVLASVITSAAPNAGALQNNRRPELAQVEAILRRRAELVLRVAVAHELRTLVLGAWGAGVFGNDPVMVADAFGDHLDGHFRGAFNHVAFAVLDSRPGQPVYNAFRLRFRR
jgi:uncharacterized protein (TIGR02452 family)